MLTKILISGYKDYLYASINSLKVYIFATIALLILGIIIGYTDSLNINNVIIDVFGSLIKKFENHLGFSLFMKIFFQNSRATLFIFLLGIIFSIFPVLATLFNGMILGCVFSNIETLSTFTKLQAILYIIPHGIFEIPAIILAVSLGIKFGLWPYNKNKLSYIKTTFIQSAQCYILVIIPLLLMAAVIETTTMMNLR